MEKKKPTLGSRVYSQVMADIESTQSEISEASTEDTKFDSDLQMTLRHIADIFSKSNPDTNADAYLRDFFIPTIQSNLDPYSVLRGEVLDFPKNTGQPDIYRPLIATLLFCKLAKNLYRQGDFDGAWSWLAEASFWCGFASAGDKMYDLSRITASEMTRAKLRGSEQSQEKRQAEVLELFTSQAPQDGCRISTRRCLACLSGQDSGATCGEPRVCVQPLFHLNCRLWRAQECMRQTGHEHFQRI